VWIYTQGNITSIIFTWVHYTNIEKSWYIVHIIWLITWYLTEVFFYSIFESVTRSDIFKMTFKSFPNIDAFIWKSMFYIVRSFVWLVELCFISCIVLVDLIIGLKVISEYLW
jgi:hypothetical protein